MFMSKRAFMWGLGAGIVLGTYLIKHCPSVREAYDTAESNVKKVVDNVKKNVQQSKEQPGQQQNASA